MNGVTINGKHSLEDYGLYLQPKSIPLPESKTNSVSPKGADGKIDLTTALTDGNTLYDNRIIELDFAVIGFGEDFQAVIDRFVNDVHGKTVQLVFDDDPEHYFTGRGEVSGRESNNGYTVISCAFDCDPYRYDIEPTVSIHDIGRYYQSPIIELNESDELYDIHCVVWVKKGRTTTNVSSANIGFGDAPKQVTETASGIYDTLGTVDVTVMVSPVSEDGYATFECIAESDDLEILYYVWSAKETPDGASVSILSILGESEEQTLNVTISNARKWTVPIIECENDIELSYQGITYNIPAGRRIDERIVLRDGENVLTFRGNGLVTLEYRQGVL